MKPIKKNFLVVGRGATAIYLILRHHCDHQEVIVPSTICYAAILPIYYSGNTPRFIDVEYPSGNLSPSELLKTINPNTGAVIYPYMYGNVTPAIHEIKQICQEHQLVLIEDCASAMGATIDNTPVGSFGDYAVFSTGHAKNVDLGNGGIVASDPPLDNLMSAYQKLPVFTSQITNAQDSFSHQYSSFRHTHNQAKIKNLFASRNDYKNLFLYQLNDPGLIQKVENSFIDVEAEKETKLQKYNQFISKLPTNICYSYNPGSFPWRFSILLNNSESKQKIIDDLLAEHLFVSDWYPCIAPFFDNTNQYPNSEKMAKEILNFTLTDSDENISRICDIINSNI